MKIVFAASECVPFAKTGGLADVVGALGPEMVKTGSRGDGVPAAVRASAPAH